MTTKFFLCTVCGNVIFKCVDSGVAVVCCGKQMQELIPATDDSAAKEKHIPVVECRPDGTILVKVGSVQHPMLPAHHISFIYLETDHGGQVKYLMPDEAPEAVFTLGHDKPVAVYEYCNIHGLWKTELKSCAERE